MIESGLHGCPRSRVIASEFRALRLVKTNVISGGEKRRPDLLVGGLHM